MQCLSDMSKKGLGSDYNVESGYHRNRVSNYVRGTSELFSTQHLSISMGASAWSISLPGTWMNEGANETQTCPTRSPGESV